MTYRHPHHGHRWLAIVLACLCCTLCAMAQTPTDTVTSTAADTLHNNATTRHHERKAVTLQEVPTSDDVATVRVVNAAGDTVTLASNDSIAYIQGVEILTDSVPASPTLGEVRAFNPDPQRALWLSALCPGLGQIYNRRYWKLPIVVGAFVGLTYGTTWNNRMYRDYSKAYRDLMDDDPDTRSYMDFFPPTVKESDLETSWLQKTMRNKRDYYRRYKEICIICMVGIYLVNIVDAYVDASLAHFDISPDLSMDVTPTAIDGNYHITGNRLPSVGLQCAITF